MRRLNRLSEDGATFAFNSQGMGGNGDFIPVHREQGASGGVVDAELSGQALEFIMAEE